MSLAPVPVASMPWRIGDSSWVLTVVCKLSLQLEPGEAQLAKRHEPIYEAEVYPDNNLGLSPLAPADLVPSRPQVDVMVVGDVYAPRGTPVPSLTARLSLATIDKTLLVEAEETGEPFATASLSYEHAEYPDNPVRGAAKAAGATHRVVSVDDELVTGLSSLGFGPLASHWNDRDRLLKGRPAPKLTDPHGVCELPEDFDLKFFNAAPPDQQLPELSPSATIVLENLHPKHPVLRCRLPNVAPQVFVERKKGRRVEKDAELAGVWIDSSRSVVALTWQCRIPLKAIDEPGKVYVAVAGPNRRLSTGQLGKLLGSLGGKAAATVAGTDDEPTTDETEDPLDATVSIRAKRLTAKEMPATKAETATSDFERFAERTSDPALAPLPQDASPAWLSQPRDPASNGAPALATQGNDESLPGAAGPPASAPASNGPATPNSQNGSSQDGHQLSPPHPPLASQPGSLNGASPGSAWMPRPPTPSRPKALGDTSSLPRVRRPAASDPAPIEPRASSGPAKQPRAKAARRHEPKETVELLWYDDEATERLRRQWPKLCEDLDFAPRDDRHDLATQDPKEARDHHTHFGVLIEARTTNRHSLVQELRESVSESGRFTPPLVVLRGQLRFPFEDIEILQATAASVAPIAGDDKKLAEALSQVKELVDTPLLAGSGETVRNFTNHLRKLFEQARRSLKLEYLDEAVERILLEQRRYQKRTLFGAEWIRALFTSKGDGKDQAIPCYLPEALCKQLPTMSQFETRLIAEAHVKQDQYESHPYALRVVTLGRIVKITG
ncbi:MAG: DUF2169 domain-containing protein [Deltaproteobacteria bacterium]|nr:DUF2169 domain-containing protein [Deltaproteobacteria bacterium]